MNHIKVMTSLSNYQVVAVIILSIIPKTICSDFTENVPSHIPTLDSSVVRCYINTHIKVVIITNLGQRQKSA